MSDRNGATYAPSAGTMRDGLRESMPLFLVAGLMFVAGVVARSRGTTVGTSHFAVAELLVALGFAAAIGGVLSWFFAGGPARPSRTEGAEPTSTDGGRLGWHPRPQVRVESLPHEVRPPPSDALSTTAPLPTAPWDEGPVDLAPPAGAPPPSSSEAESTFRELDGIQEELSTRRGRGPSTRP